MPEWPGSSQTPLVPAAPKSFRAPETRPGHHRWFAGLKAFDLTWSRRHHSGFEPKAPGRHQGHRDYYGLGPETTDSLGVVRDSPSLPVSGYPSSTESDGPNLDTKWTPIESARRWFAVTRRSGSRPFALGSVRLLVRRRG